MRASAILPCVAAITIVLFAGACASGGASPEAAQATAQPDLPLTPLVLAPNEGERRIRRVMGGALAIIKVDRRNGGSPALMMGYEELPVGQTINPHRHPGMDEIIFVHRGTGTAGLGDKTATVSPGTTVFIPRGTRITLQNTGTEPLAIAFFFPQPGYEEYLRDTSAPEGTAAAPLTPPELTVIRERHKAHIVFDR